MLTSLHSGNWDPDKPKTIEKYENSNEFFLEGIVENINKKFKDKMSDKLYVIYIKLSKNFLNVLEFHDIAIENNEKRRKKSNTFTQFWQMIDWVLKQASKNQLVLWVDFHGNCSNKYDLNPDNIDLAIYRDKHQLRSTSVNYSNIHYDFYTYLLRESNFKIKYQSKNSNDQELSINNENINNLIGKNKFVFYLRIVVNYNLITDEIKYYTLINNITNFLIRFLKY